MVEPLDRTLRQLSIVMILGYQRFLSPYKGYACAHRVWHGDASCSEFARGAFASESFRTALRMLKMRFRECHAASLALRELRLHSTNRDEANDGPVALESRSSSESDRSGQRFRFVGDQLAECCCQCGGESIAECALSHWF